MTSDRPYRRAMSAAEALYELRRCSGAQFDADVVQALVAVIGGRETESAAPEPVAGGVPVAAVPVAA
jgi:HD-GYP domain-containing protein (c-di-GMP phosphodiesterase class II)